MNLTTDSGDTGHDTGDYYSVSMSNLFGYGTVRFTGYRPDFANDAGTVTFTYDILADGRVIAHETLVLNGNPSLEDVDTQTWNGYLGSPDVVLSIDNVEMVCQYIDVRYVDAAGNDISAHVVDGGVGTIFGTTSSSLDISLESDGVYETGTDYRWSVEGATVTGGNSGTGTVDTADTKTITPTGNDFVTITYSGMTEVPGTYTVTVDSSVSSTVAAIIDRYDPATGTDVDGAADSITDLGLGVTESTNIRIDFQATSTPANEPETTSGINTGDTVVMNVVLGNGASFANTDIYDLTVTVTVNGDEYSHTFTTPGSTASFWFDRVSGDLVVEDVEITAVEKLEVDVADSSVNEDGTVVTIAFNQALSAVKQADFTQVGTSWGADNAIIGFRTVGNDTVELTFRHALPNAAKIQIEADVLGQADRTTNTNIVDAANADVVNISATGTPTVWSIGSVSGS